MKQLLLILSLLFYSTTNLFAQSNHKGKVLETFQVENYTYVKINENSKDVWIAIPKLDVKVDDTIETSEGIIMKDFRSTSLKRTFPEIIFATKATIIESKNGKNATTTNKIPGIFNVSKVIEHSSDLKGKTISFKGKITKFTPNIMNKNWLHLSDPNNEKTDIVVTTNENVNVGDIVTMEGTLETNKDLGAGYYFKVIIEDAKLVK
ncbi:MAG: hypothetical protein N2202_04600 [Proteobacteria bacterium]|nr:hypothetical protein [Pseudomonadota bacterium]